MGAGYGFRFDRVLESVAENDVYNALRNDIVLVTLGFVSSGQSSGKNNLISQLVT